MLLRLHDIIRYEPRPRWQKTQPFGKAECLRYHFGSFSGTQSLASLITTHQVADIDWKKTINLDSIKRFALTCFSINRTKFHPCADLHSHSWVQPHMSGISDHRLS